MPGQGLQFNIQGGPEYQQQIHKDILKQAKERLEKPYESYQRLAPEQRERQQKKLAELETLIKGPKEAFIPLYVTGSSQSIGVTPAELQEIIKNKHFAERLISASTGIVRVPKEEIEDLQDRANKIYESRKNEITESSKYQEELGKREELLRKEELSKIGKENQIKLEKEKDYLNRIEDFEKHFKFSKGKENSIIDIMKKGTKLPTDSPLYNNLFNKNKEYNESISKLRLLPSSPSSFSNIGKTVPKEPLINDTEIEREKQRVKKEIETLSKSSTLPLPPSITSQFNVDPLLKRAGAEREIVKLMAPQQNLAPLEKQHYQALGMLEKSFDDDALKLAQSELDKAKEHNILSKVEPWVRESVESPDVYTQKYIKNYQDNVIKSLQDEYRRSFLEDIFPKIEARYIGKGSYNSGARLQAINRASQSADRSLRNEIGKLLSHAHDKGMEHHQTEKSRKLAAAQVIGGAAQQEREAVGRGAEQFRTLGLTKQALTHANVGALSHFATAEQQQEQNRLNLAKQEYERAKNHEMENLKTMHNIALGFPAGPTQQIVGTPVNPTPPNPYNLASGALGALAMLNSPQQQQQRVYAKGGLVRKRYAGGGDVNSSSLEDEMRNLMMQREMDYRRQLHETQQPNTLNALTANITQAMLSNMRGNPLENLGKGISNTVEGMSASKQREANLIDKINDSRMQQYKILAEFENRKAEREHKENILGETNRRHHESLAQSARHHHENLAAKYAKIDSSGGVETKESTKARIKKNSEIRDEMEALLKTSEEGLRISNALESVTKRTNTGPIAGGLHNIPGIGPYLHGQLGFGSPEDIQELEGLSTEAALAEERTYPAKAQTVALLNAIQKTKPNKSLFKKENVRRAEKKKEKFLEGEDKAKFIIGYVDNGYGDETEALKKYNELRRNQKSQGKKIISSNEENPEEDHASSPDHFGEWNEYEATPIPE